MCAITANEERVQLADNGELGASAAWYVSVKNLSLLNLGFWHKLFV